MDGLNFCDMQHSLQVQTTCHKTIHVRRRKLFLGRTKSLLFSCLSAKLSVVGGGGRRKWRRREERSQHWTTDHLIRAGAMAGDCPSPPTERTILRMTDPLLTPTPANHRMLHRGGARRDTEGKKDQRRYWCMSQQKNQLVQRINEYIIYMKRCVFGAKTHAPPQSRCLRPR